MSENIDVKMARLEEKIENLTKAVDKQTASLDNLRTSFPTRTEFDIVKIAVMGTANDGGLVKKVDELEKSAERRSGTWSTIQIMWTIGIALAGILITIFVK